MFGFSIFLNQELTENTKAYIKAMADCGFGGIFTSLHIPEDDATRYKKRLAELGALAKAQNLELMVDISGKALQQAGFSFEQPQELRALGVTGLRMDYHISNQQIATLSHQLTVALNASTLTAQDIAELQQAGADFKNLEAWHNYYPRPETGLDQTWFNEKNHWLKAQGFTVQAFVCGDENLRGPLFKGLPTLEDQRDVTPFAAALALQQTVDRVYIGDGGLSKASQKKFATYLKTATISLLIESLDASSQYVLGDHCNRQDDARDVIRSAAARFKNIPNIPPLEMRDRLFGSVTLDNEKYLRYMGEIQLTKRDLPADEKVNVVARVVETDRALIPLITAGTKFKLESVEK